MRRPKNAIRYATELLWQTCLIAPPGTYRFEDDRELRFATFARLLDVAGLGLTDFARDVRVAAVFGRSIIFGRFGPSVFVTTGGSIRRKTAIRRRTSLRVTTPTNRPDLTTGTRLQLLSRNSLATSAASVPGVKQRMELDINCSTQEF